MHRARAVLAAVTSLAIIAALPGAARAGALNAGASCPDGSHISFSWSWYEDPAHPTGHPEWVGYDVYRRSLADCGGLERVNAAPYPRTPGASEGFTYTEVPPATGTTYNYEVFLVDAARQQVFLDPVACDCASHHGWASAPAFSAPITQGTLNDLGWALYIQPCADGCNQSFYITGPQADALRPYAGTGTALRFFGSAGCESLEGCGLGLDHYEVAPCGPTPTRHSSWGRVKAIYR